MPASYLSAWHDPDTPGNQTPYVWVFPREGGDGRRKAPSNIFHETDMYTIHGPDGTRDLRLEHGLSQLEGDFVTLRRDKLEKLEQLDDREEMLLAVFVAAMKSRSRRQRDHERSQWQRIKDLGDRIRKSMLSKSPEERARIGSLGAPPKPEPTLSADDVARLAESPLQETMVASIQTRTSMLLEMDVAIICTDDDLGFISSDAPCVLFDPEARSRPFPYNVTGMSWPRAELTLPISPRLLVAYNRQGLTGYQNAASLSVVDTLNQHRVFNAEKEIVCRRNTTRPSWFSPAAIE